MKKGFTLIELLAVIVILAVILVIAVPKVVNVIKTVKQSTLDSDAALISKQLELYKESEGLDVATLEQSDLDTYGFKTDKYDGFKAEVINNKVVVTLIKDDLIGSNYAGSKIYGVTFSNSSTGTRTDSAVGATYSGTTAITSSFDTEEIYSEMIEETDSYGNQFIKIPKFYIKKTKSTGNVWTYQISKTKVDSDYYLPACFVDEATNTILPYILVGKYNANLNGTKLESKTGTVPLVSQNISYFRTAARANGAGYQLLDIHTWDAIQTLFYVEFATLDSQSIMAGYTASTNTVKLNNGTADSISKTGSPTNNTNGLYAMKYRGIENLWGNIWQFVDGINIQNNIAYVSKDASAYASNIFSGAYKKVGYTNKNANGLVSEMGYDYDNPYVNLPISVTGTAIYGDYYYQASDSRIARVGGDWYYSCYAGVSSWYLYSYSGYANSSVGSRLLKTPL
ncbi:MAG: type II secretion system protein [Bacilli bacterium]|nr:type II secretion system protein [Bacilli bacterium]